jgi:DNA-binding transcriptional ArsR family regulator
VKSVLQYEPLDLVFHALADPGRRSMVERLTHGPASVSELARPLDMTLTAVVQHVRVLEASGLVTSRKQGRTRTCRLQERTLRQAEAWIAERRQLWERRLDRLGELLSEAEPDLDHPDLDHPDHDHPDHDHPGHERSDTA